MAAEEKGAMVSSLQQQEPTASQADGEATQLQVQERAVASLAASSAATTVLGPRPARRTTCRPPWTRRRSK
eukprot:607965-Prymnesium_polylepis.1